MRVTDPLEPVVGSPLTPSSVAPHLVETDALASFASALSLLQTTGFTIGSHTDLEKLEPALQTLRGLIGVDDLVLGYRVPGTLRLQSALHHDVLLDFATIRDRSDGSRDDTRSHSLREALAQRFPGSTGIWIELLGGSQDEPNGALIALRRESELSNEAKSLLAPASRTIATILDRITDREASREASALRLLLTELGSPLLQETHDESGDFRAMTSALAGIAETLDADEVLWGNRGDVGSANNAQRYRRGHAAEKLPGERLRIAAEFDGTSGVVVSTFTEEAHLALGIEPADATDSTVWAVPIASDEQPILGLVLFFRGRQPDLGSEEVQFLLEANKTLLQFDNRISEQRSLERRASFRRLEEDIGHYLVEAAGRQTSPTVVIEWTLEQLGQAFNADMGTWDSTTSFANWGTSDGLDINRRLIDIEPFPFVRDTARSVLSETGTALLQLPDFPDAGRPILEQLGAQDIVAAAALAEGESPGFIGMLSWHGQDWTTDHLTVLKSVGVMLNLATDAIEARLHEQLSGQLKDLAGRVSSCLSRGADAEQALTEILPDICSTVGGVGASWLEVSPSLRRYDLLGTVVMNGSDKLFPPQTTIEFTLDDWATIGHTPWPPGLYGAESELMATVKKYLNVTWFDRLLLPVNRDGKTIAALTILWDTNETELDVGDVVPVLMTIAELIFESFEAGRLSQLFSATFDSAPSGQLILDVQGQVRAINTAASSLGLIDIGQDWRVVDPTFAPTRGEHELLVETGRQRRWLRVQSSEIKNKATQDVVINIEDISEAVAARQALEHEASHDQLTGLANRRLLDTRLTRAVRDLGASIVMIDVDRFKSINDSLGHHAGDAVLVTLADRLRTSVRSGDLVCRFGGDEFAILFEGPRDRHELAGFANRTLDHLRAPIDLEGHTVNPTCSLGIATIKRGEDPESVLRFSDAALVTAKNAGKDGYAFFQESDIEQLGNRLSIETGIRDGLDNDEFVTWFQPEYNIDTGRVCSLEALVRWRRPGVGLVAANEFIDVAEEMNVASRLSEIALEESTAHASEWTAQAEDLTIRVNITAGQLQGKQLEVSALRALSLNNLKPENLCLEITERSLLVDVEQSISSLGRLRSHGIRIAIDDFGTGFSSLNWLKRLPVDAIKIDRSFIGGITSDPVDREIVGTIIKLADALNLETVAEGVENEDQAAVLLQLGCSRAQGWLWSQAVEAADVPRLLPA